MGNDRVIETACWRIWYRLEQRGECTGQNLMANAGVGTDVFDEAMDAMMNFGNVKEVDHNDRTDESTYALADDKARMMQIFPTIHNEELE